MAARSRLHSSGPRDYRCEPRSGRGETLFLIMKNLRIGIDTGGTFTDFVVIRDGRIEMFKELSTPHSPEEAIMTGMSRLDGSAQEIIHGSTVATNALLERKGARTALLTTEGFEDVLVI